MDFLLKVFFFFFFPPQPPPPPVIVLMVMRHTGLISSQIDVLYFLGGFTKVSVLCLFLLPL